MSNVRAHYTEHCITPDTIWIIDNDDGAMSVTNDAENVVAEIYAKHGNLRIIYRDSMGKWDELLHDKGRFTGFLPARHLLPPEFPI